MKKEARRATTATEVTPITNWSIDAAQPQSCIPAGDNVGSGCQNPLARRDNFLRIGGHSRGRTKAPVLELLSLIRPLPQPKSDGTNLTRKKKRPTLRPDCRPRC